MKVLRDMIDDTIAEFRMKTPSEKRYAIKIYIVRAIVVVGLICSPVIITRLHDALRDRIDNHVLQGLSTEEKWDLVRMGRAHVECIEGTDDALRDKGLNPSTPEGTNYALESGYCKFVSHP